MGNFFDRTDIEEDVDKQAKIVQLGSRVSIANTPEKIRIQLPNGGRDWFLLKPRDYPTFNVHRDRSTKLFKRKSSQEITNATRSDGDYVMVFILQTSTPKNTNHNGGGSSINYDSMFGELSGAVKQLAIDLAKKNAAMSAAWMGMSLAQKKDGTKRTFEKDGNDILSVNGADEQAGADKFKKSKAAAAAMSAVMIAATGPKYIIKNPKSVFDDFKKAITDTRSPSEALGKAGMEQAKTRLELKTDNRFKDRYHGPDDMVKDKNGKLTEIESKGNNTNSKAVAKDKNKNKQGSSAKNLKRAKTMIKKSKKIGLSSNRQGGAYTAKEQELWGEVKKLQGNKRHVSSHTNTETGQVKVYERDSRGEVSKKLDDFKLDDFDEMKSTVKKHFSK